MKIKHTFKGSKDVHGYGYFAFIDGDTNELVIGENRPHEGGELFRGTYVEAASRTLRTLAKEAPTLANAIEDYYMTHLFETNNTTLSCLHFGDKFYHNTHKYMVIDMNVSTCFINTAGKESSIVCALDLESYKVFCFDKALQVSPYHE